MIFNRFPRPAFFSRRTTSQRRAAYRLGGYGEQVAIFVLMLKGYKILERRFKLSGGEVDLIVKRGRTIAFIEVKTRQNTADALASLLPAQEIRIRHSAALWQARRDPASAFDIRFDLLVVSPFTFPIHLQNAF